MSNFKKFVKLTPIMLKTTQKFVSEYRILMLGNNLTGKFTKIYIPINRLEQAKSRFCRKVMKNSAKFRWWITLTFPNYAGNWSVENDKGIIHKFFSQYSLNDVLEFEHLINKKRDIKLKGISAFMRRFLNRIQTRLRKIEKKCSYAYIYEEGEKGGRPHYHMLMSDIGIDDKEKLFEFLFKSWESGNIEIEEMDDNPDKVYNYLSSYLNKEKKFEHSQFTGRRFWNTTRDILPPKKNPLYQYIGVFGSVYMANLVSRAIDFDLFEMDNTPFKLNFIRLFKMVKKEPNILRKFPQIYRQLMTYSILMNKLFGLDWRILEFLGSEYITNMGSCVPSIRSLCSISSQIIPSPEIL